jgi:hypothetical protein
MSLWVKVPVSFLCFDAPFNGAVFTDNLFGINNLVDYCIKNTEFPIFGEVELIPAFRPLYGMEVKINLVLKNLLVA